MDSHYQRNKEVYKQRARRREKDILAFVRSLKDGKTCLRCGFADARALEFHHRDSSTKTANLGNINKHGWSRERILAEIAKCDLICANCHAIEHHSG